MMRHGMILWESIVALIIVGVIAVPLMHSFLHVDVWVYERLEVDRRLEERLEDQLELPMTQMTWSVTEKTSAGKEYWIQMDWLKESEQECLTAKAKDGERVVSQLQGCRYVGELNDSKQ